MLEIIYSILSWWAIAFTIYTGYSIFRYAGDSSLDKTPVKVIDSLVIKCMILGITFGACIVIDFYLPKDVITIIVDYVCSIIWLKNAKKYLKVSNVLKERENKK